VKRFKATMNVMSLGSKYRRNL